MKTKGLNNYFTLTSVVIGFAATAGSLNAADALTETFVTGERLTQSLPSTSAWYTSFNSQSSDASGDLVVNDNVHVISYFTDSGSPLTLNSVGDSITASVTFSMDSPVASTSGFRIALLDSNGTRLSADNTGNDNAAFENNYFGYGAFFNLNAATAMRLYERDVANETKLINGNNAWTQLTAGSTGTGTTFGTGDYTADITLLQTVSGIEISVTLAGVTGYTATITDTTDLRTVFDTIAIYGAGSAMGDDYTLKSVTISSIPEPSAAALLMGATASLLLVSRRRRK